MFCQKSRDCQSAFILMPHANAQRLQAAMQQKRGVRIERAAEMIRPVRDASDPVAAANYGARGNVVVSVQILRTAVKRKVKADLGRTEIDRTGEGIIDHRDQAVSASKPYHRLQVADLKQGVGHRLDIDRLRRRRELFLPRIRIVSVDPINGNAEQRTLLSQETMG